MYTQWSYAPSQCSVCSMWATITGMASGLPDEFSRETLFLLESSLDLIHTCTLCSPCS